VGVKQVVDRAEVIVFVREIRDGRVVGESRSQTITVYGVEGLAELADKLPSMLGGTDG